MSEDTPTAPETAILPCPFCGGGRIKAHHIRDGRSMGCMDCGATVHKFNGPTDITDALMAKWNRRAPSPEVATLRASEARMREALAIADTTIADLERANASYQAALSERGIDGSKGTEE